MKKKPCYRRELYFSSNANNTAIFFHFISMYIIEIFSYLSYFSFHIKKITQDKKRRKNILLLFLVFFLYSVFLHKVHFQFDFMLFSFRFISLLQFPHTDKLCSISLSNTIPIPFFLLWIFISSDFLHNICVGRYTTAYNAIDETSYLGFILFLHTVENSA